MIYRALHKQLVRIPYSCVEVDKGELVDFDHDPGEGWEVKDAIHTSSDKRTQRRTVDEHGLRDDHGSKDGL